MGMVKAEKGFQRQVTDLADLFGWWWMHISDSRKQIRDKTDDYKNVGDAGITGWPDLVLWHPDKPGIYFRELKAHPQRRKFKTCTDDQIGTLTSLHEAGQDVDVWCPDDWPEIQAFLESAR